MRIEQGTENLGKGGTVLSLKSILFLCILIWTTVVFGLPNDVRCEHFDMSEEWLVRVINDDNCAALFEQGQLTGTARDWYDANGIFEGQVEYFFGEGAYKCGLSDTTSILFEFAVDQFTTALSIQLGSSGQGPLSNVQVENLYFRRAWAYFRLAEYLPPSDMEGIKGYLNSGLFDLSPTAIQRNGSSLSIGASYLSAEIKLQLLFLSYFNAGGFGPDEYTSTLQTLVRNAEGIRSEFGELEFVSPPDDGKLTIDPSKFSDSVRINITRLDLFIARLQLLQNSSSAIDYLDSGPTGGGTVLDAIQKFEFERLKWFKEGKTGNAKNLRSLLSQISDPLWQTYYHVLLLVELESLDEILRLGESVVTEVPFGYYWFGKVQALSGKTKVEEFNQRYHPKELLQLFLASPPALGDSYYRMDAQIQIYEISFEEALGGPSSNLENALKNLCSQMGTFYPINVEVNDRKNGILKMLSVYGVECGASSSSDEGILLSLIEAGATVSSNSVALIFIGEAFDYLDALRGDSVFGSDKWNFYSAVLEKVWALRIPNTGNACSTKLKNSMRLAGLIPSGSDFYPEAQYLQALSAKLLLFFENTTANKDQAIRLLSSVAINHGNSRALYYLAGELKGTPNDLQAADYANMVKLVIMNQQSSPSNRNKNCKFICSGMGDSFFKYANSLFPGAPIPTQSITINGQSFDMNHFKYPHITLENCTFLEEFADEKNLRKKKMDRFTNGLSQHYPISPGPYISENRVNGWIWDSCYQGFNSGILDGPMRVMTALKMNVRTSISPSVEFDGTSLAPSGGSGLYEVSDLQGGSEHTVKITCMGYFPWFANHKFKGSPFDKSLENVYLADKTEYSSSTSNIPEGPVAFVAKNEEGDKIEMGNKIFTTTPTGHPEFLNKKMGYEVRDFVKSGNFYYCVNASKNSIDKISVKSQGNGVSHLTGYNQKQFKSIEGITMDQHGNFYVADFGAHVVVVFDAMGQYTHHFGTESGEIKLQFPTRVALEEDLVGFTHEGRTFYRPSFLYVSDWNGVHRMDLFGHKIDTVAKVGDGGMKPGDFYGIGVTGYGPEAELIVLKRDGDQALKFKATKAP